MNDRRKILATGRKNFMQEAVFQLALQDLWTEMTGNSGRREEQERHTK